MKTIYLCGGIKDISFENASEWRTQAIKKLPYNDTGFKFLNPMRRNFRDCEFQSQNEIIQLDKNDIIASDILLVNATKPSWGTAMEILFAYERNKIVVVFSGGNYVDVSPWVAYHATRVTRTMEEAITYIKKQFT